MTPQEPIFHAWNENQPVLHPVQVFTVCGKMVHAEQMAPVDQVNCAKCKAKLKEDDAK